MGLAAGLGVAPGVWSPPLVTVSLVLVTLTGLPGLFRRLLGARPLAESQVPPGWKTLAHRLGVELPPVWIWPTRGRRVGALLVGLVPGYRAVVLTDELVNRLEPLELEAVLTHELAHLGRRHLLVRLLVVLTPAGLWLAWWRLTAPVGGPTPTIAAAGISVGLVEQLGLIAAWAGYVWLVFGWVARRLESEADFEAQRVLAQTPGGADYARALERLGKASGWGPDRRTWQHGNIAGRLAWLKAAGRQPKVADRLRGQIRLVGALAAGLLAGGLATDLVARWAVWAGSQFG